MALWEITYSQANSHAFREVIPNEVLITFDGPLTFTFRDARGNLMLAHLCAVALGKSRYLVCKTDELTISDLKNGMISIRSAIVRPRLWIIDVLSTGTVDAVWETSQDTLPVNVLPDPDVLLTPELEAAQAADDKLARFAKSGSDGQIAFDGSPVTGHQVQATFFSGFWQRFQQLLDATGKAIYGNDIPEGKLSIYLGMTSPSSYAISVTLPVDENSKELFSDRAPDEQKIKGVFNAVMSMVADGQKPNEVELINRYQDVRLRYGGLLELVSQKSANVVIRTRANPNGMTLTSDQAGRKLSAVRQLGYPYGTIVAQGRFVGGLVEKFEHDQPTFYLRVDDKTHYSGTVSERAIEKMKSLHLDQMVKATLRVHAERTDAPQKYRLEDVEPIAVN